MNEGINKIWSKEWGDHPLISLLYNNSEHNFIALIFSPQRVLVTNVIKS